MDILDIPIVGATNRVLADDDIHVQLVAALAAAHNDTIADDGTTVDPTRSCLGGQNPDTYVIIQPGRCCDMCEYNECNDYIIDNDYADANENRGYACCMQPGANSCLGLDVELRTIIQQVLDDHTAAVQQGHKP